MTMHQYCCSNVLPGGEIYMHLESNEYINTNVRSDMARHSFQSYDTFLYQKACGPKIKLYGGIHQFLNPVRPTTSYSIRMETTRFSPLGMNHDVSFS